jgi:hypothetical protein
MAEIRNYWQALRSWYPSDCNAVAVTVNGVPQFNRKTLNQWATRKHHIFADHLIHPEKVASFIKNETLYKPMT